MRTFLTLAVYARASALLHIRSLAQTAVLLHRENRHIASGVIRYQNEPAAGIHVHITGVSTQRWFLIQQAQFARPLIDRKGADGAAFLILEVLDFVDGVQITPAGCKSEKRWVNNALRGGYML